jgi:hypothetical protein
VNGFLLPIAFNDEEYIKCIETVFNDYEKFSKNALASSVVFNADGIAALLVSDIKKAISKK